MMISGVFVGRTEAEQKNLHAYPGASFNFHSTFRSEGALALGGDFSISRRPDINFLLYCVQQGVYHLLA
jgi:hypothetical protein